MKGIKSVGLPEGVEGVDEEPEHSHGPPTSADDDSNAADATRDRRGCQRSRHLERTVASIHAETELKIQAMEKHLQALERRIDHVVRSSGKAAGIGEDGMFSFDLSAISFVDGSMLPHSDAFVVSRTAWVNLVAKVDELKVQVQSQESELKSVVSRFQRENRVLEAQPGVSDETGRRQQGDLVEFFLTEMERRGVATKKLVRSQEQLEQQTSWLHKTLKQVKAQHAQCTQQTQQLVCKLQSEMEASNTLRCEEFALMQQRQKKWIQSIRQRMGEQLEGHRQRVLGAQQRLVEEWDAQLRTIANEISALHSQVQEMGLDVRGLRTATLSNKKLVQLVGDEVLKVKASPCQCSCASVWPQKKE